MADPTNPNLGGYVIQLVPPLSDMENYWRFQGYSPFQYLVQADELDQIISIIVWHLMYY